MIWGYNLRHTFIIHVQKRIIYQAASLFSGGAGHHEGRRGRTNHLPDWPLPSKVKLMAKSPRSTPSTCSNRSNARPSPLTLLNKVPVPRGRVGRAAASDDELARRSAWIAVCKGNDVPGAEAPPNSPSDGAGVIETDMIRLRITPV